MKHLAEDYAVLCAMFGAVLLFVAVTGIMMIWIDMPWALLAPGINCLVIAVVLRAVSKRAGGTA